MIKECEERDKADSRAERETLKSIKFMYQWDAAQKELDNLKNGGEGYVPWSKYKYQKEINDTLNE